MDDATSNAAAMTERLIDAAIYYEQCDLSYRVGARRELIAARAAIEEALASLSPAATPVSEAGGEFEVSHRIAVLGLKAALAKPASSPAGGDVDIEAHALKALMKAIQRAEDGAGTLPAKEAVKLRPTDWHAVCDRARKLDALSQSTSAGRFGE